MSTWVSMRLPHLRSSLTKTLDRALWHPSDTPASPISASALRGQCLPGARTLSPSKMTVECRVTSPTASSLGFKGSPAAPAALGTPTLPKAAAAIDAVRRLPTDLERFLFLRRLQ